MPHPALNALFESAEALPTVPKIVHQLLRSLSDENVNLKALAAQIGADPVISAKLLRMANSAYFDVQHRVGSVDEALRMFGFLRVRTLVISSSMTGAFHKFAGMDMSGFWRLSFHTASIARWLGQHLGADADRCFMIGISHGIGHLIMWRALPGPMRELDRQTLWYADDRPAHETAALGFHFGEVSGELARRWKFPLDLAIALDTMPLPLSSSPMVPYAGIVHLARWRARLPENPTADALKSSYPADVSRALGLGDSPDWLPELAARPAGETLPPLSVLYRGTDDLLG